MSEGGGQHENGSVQGYLEVALTMHILSDPSIRAPQNILMEPSGKRTASGSKSMVTLGLVKSEGLSRAPESKVKFKASVE